MILARPDGSFVITVNGMPYHTTPGDRHYQETLDALALGEPSESEPEFVPPPRDEVAELRSYLSLTDWYVVRFSETGKPTPDDIAKTRQVARDRISELKG